MAALPLCLLGQEMRNRRILDDLFHDAGAAVVPAIETDSVSALFAHVATHRWSSVIAHAWLHMIGVPKGMRIVPMETPPRSPQIGLVTAERSPEPVVVRALLDVARGLDLRAPSTPRSAATWLDRKRLSTIGTYALTCVERHQRWT